MSKNMSACQIREAEKSHNPKQKKSEEKAAVPIEFELHMDSSSY